MKVLVTGANGRLGRSTCPMLQAAGMELRATDRRADSNLPYRIDVATLLDREQCYRLVEGVDAVVHLGNWPNAAMADAQTVYADNCSMNINVFQAAKELGVRRIVFASTIQVILGDRRYPGAKQPAPRSELAYLPLNGSCPPNIGNVYAASKLAAEQLLHHSARHHGLHATAIRFPMLLDRDHFSTFAGMLDRVWEGYTLDEAFTSLTFNDAARLILATLQANAEGYRVYQPAARSPWLMLSIQELISRFFADVPLNRPLHEMRSLVDLSEIEAETGWQPQDEIAGPRAAAAV